MRKCLDRREFMAATAAGLTLIPSATAAEGAIPRRALGRTGGEVSILGFGGGSRFLSYPDEDLAIRILNEAIDAGINYLDTAQDYGSGRSEELYGKVLKDRRSEVWVTTKVTHRGYDDAMREMELSLKRLQTDQVDLLHIHSLERADDLARIEQPDGVLKALYRIREEGMARFIGMTSHTDAATMKRAIERHDLDCVMMALNAATRTGFSTGFEEIALPAAQAKGLGILAMKITGQEHLIGEATGRAGMRDLLYYSMSLPVASCIVGMPQPEHVRENIALARSFEPLTEVEKARIRGQVAASAVAFDRFLQHHRDGDVPAYV